MAPRFWTMTSGKRVLIREMCDRHLLNTIRMLLRHAAHKQWAMAVRGDAILEGIGGEMAGYLAANAIDEFVTADPEEVAEQEWPEFVPLTEEAEARGLDWRTYANEQRWSDVAEDVVTGFMCEERATHREA